MAIFCSIKVCLVSYFQIICHLPLLLWWCHHLQKILLNGPVMVINVTFCYKNHSQVHFNKYDKCSQWISPINYLAHCCIIKGPLFVFRNGPESDFCNRYLTNMNLWKSISNILNILMKIYKINHGFIKYHLILRNSL